VIESLAAKAGARIDSSRPIQDGTRYALSRGAEKAVVNVYRTGKVLVQQQSALADELRALLAKGRAKSEFASWCGTDESGKGDYFGPLAVAGVALTREQAEELAGLGVRDSKTVGDETACELDRTIRASCLARLVYFAPEAYNALHDRLRNVNRILGEAHARAIDQLAAERGDLQAAIADQFGDERYIADELARKGRAIRLIQRPRAESDVAVAAASLVARAGFLRGLQALRTKFGVEFPKGAGPDVVAAAREFVRRRGREALSKVAKVHFATTGQL
jgi:ribonuclease HIII